MSKPQIFITALLIIVLVALGYTIWLVKFQLQECIVASQGGLGGVAAESADWTNPEKPSQSLPVSEKDIPKEALRIGITAEGFNPESFEAKAGEKIILAVSSLDNWVHVFKFKDPVLSEVALGLAAHQTRMISFYAPKEPGEYPFYCDVPGHEARGESGKMIVK